MRKAGTVAVTFMFVAACGLLAVGLAARLDTQNANSDANKVNANAKTNASKANENDRADANADAHDAASKRTPDAKFVVEAAMGGRMEVELGRLAAERAASEEVRQFARLLVTDHSAVNEGLAQRAGGLGLALPSGLDEKHREQLAKFSALSGERFDREFVRHMIKDHKKVVAAFEKQSERGADADLKAFAGRALPVLREHLRMVQRIHDKMQMRRHLPSTNANR